jgi:hypothetical protein
MTSEPPEVPPKTRWLLYAGAWGAVFLGCTVVSPILHGSTPGRDSILIGVIFSWLFPAGLITWFHTGSPDTSENLPRIVLIWLAYLVHGYFALSSRTRFRFYGLLLILAIVLVFNVVGCETTGA